MMHLSERDACPVPGPLTGIALAGLVISVSGGLNLGILPPQIIDLAQASVATIF